MGKTKSKARAGDGSEHLQVKPGVVLQWPSEAGATARGGHGTVVRRDDPLAAPFFHLLEAAPAGAQVSAHDCALADREYRRLGYVHAPPYEPQAAAQPPAKPTPAPTSTSTPTAPSAAAELPDEPKPATDAGDGSA